MHHKVMKAEAKLNYNDRNKTLTTAACIGDLFFLNFTVMLTLPSQCANIFLKYLISIITKKNVTS